MKGKLFLVIFLVTIFSANLSFAQEPLFKDGDRVCYIGSSISMNGANTHFVNLFYATRYPERKITFINCGISGDNTSNILHRMKSDILVNNPTWAILQIEENDLNPSLYYKSRLNEPLIMEKRKNALERWFKNADSIVRILLAADVKVILQTPTIYDQTANVAEENALGINDSLKKCMIYLKELGAKYKLPVVDCWTILFDVNKKIQEHNIKKSIIGRDRVHVSELGHFVMAYQFIKTLPVTKEVYHITIDAGLKKLKQQVNCSVSNLVSKKNVTSFNSISKSLPFPSPKGINVDSLFEFTDELNADILQINGLAKGNYKLSIDTVTVGVFNNNIFAKGINLSRFTSTPQYLQAKRILSLFDDYWKIERDLRIIKYV
ncbi:MAG: SGNH/GDSL hydrolase family protein, partial [Ginsengibacter sp.]